MCGLEIVLPKGKTKGQRHGRKSETTGLEVCTAGTCQQQQHHRGEHLATSVKEDGSPGGPYDENYPPARKSFRGFLKGNLGIIWGDTTAEAAGQESDEKGSDIGATSDGPGYCPQCGYSLYYYAEHA